MTRREPACGTCKFWRADYDGAADKYSALGECRRYAPKPREYFPSEAHDMGHGEDTLKCGETSDLVQFTHPATINGYWCGEYKAANDENKN